MSLRPGSSDRVRLFVALELPEAVRAEITRWREPVLVANGESLRAVAPENLHVTLCFLGWRAPGDADPIASACEQALAGASASAVLLGEGLWLPARRPRVLARGLGDPAGSLAHMQAAVSGALANAGWYDPGARPYLPHVSVARVRTRIRPTSVALPPSRDTAFVAAGVVLLRSHLGPAGARYEPLWRAVLPPGAPV